VAKFFYLECLNVFLVSSSSFPTYANNDLHFAAIRVVLPST